jgi:hypothetical protein
MVRCSIKSSMCRSSRPTTCRRLCPRCLQRQQPQHSHAVADELPLALLPSPAKALKQHIAAPPPPTCPVPLPPRTRSQVASSNVPLSQLSLSRPSGRRIRRHQEPHAPPRHARRCVANVPLELALFGDGSASAHCLLHMDISVVGVPSAPTRPQLVSIASLAKQMVTGSEAARQLPPTCHGVPTLDLFLACSRRLQPL